MKKKMFTLALAILFSLSFVNLALSLEKGGIQDIPLGSKSDLQGGKKFDEDNYVKGQFFVKFKNPAGKPEFFDKLPAEEIFAAIPILEEIAQAHKINPKKTRRLFGTLLNSKREDVARRAAGLTNVFLIEADTEDSSKFIEELMKLTDIVVYAERVPKIEAFFLPNDPSYSQQWHLPKTQAGEAWDIYQANSNASDVVVAIVDDAIKLGHEDLQANIWINPGEIPNNGIDDDNNGYVDDINGYDVANNDNDPNPPSNATNSYFMHGTHVAGIAAAVSNNGIGIASISSGGNMNKVKIMVVKTKLDSSAGGSLEATLEGVQYAIAAGADIINMSWGGYGYSQTYQDLFITAHSLGITLVAAAGNDGWQTYMYPASYLYVISVGATDQADHKAYFSNYGYQIDVMAPGLDIFSTLPVNNNSYGNLSGTSMASPLVAGLCALMRSYNSTLTPRQIELILKQSCDNIDAQNSNYVGRIGSGRINAYSVMQALQAVNIPAPENFTAINTSLTPSAWGEAVWGDYDNDGKLDVLIAEGGASSSVPRIYHNDGLVNGEWQFTNINAQLGSSLNMCSAAWFDYDNDGLLDFAMAGSGSSPYNNLLKIFHNDGIVNNQWKFTLLNNQPIILPGSACVSGSRLAWGDYDNDGRPDIAMIGWHTMRIYHNDGLVNCQWQFSLAPVVGLPPENLIGYAYGYVAWGDYNNDGRLDLAVTGSGNQSTLGTITKIYRNDGLVNGQWQFTDINAGLMNLGVSCIAWGDYNNDGLLDILVGGNDFLPPGIWHMKVYRNDGVGPNGQWQFTDIGADLPTVNCWGPHNFGWGDFNNDGQLDIVLAGEYNDGDPYDGHSITAVYINNNGVFSEDNSELLGITAASWGDYDGDGKLDILSTGFVDMGLNYIQIPIRTQIYHNNVLTANTTPNPPSASSLQATVTGQDVVLSWQKGSDNQTPQNGLYYNIFVGTGPNLGNTLSPMSAILGGLRRVAAIGGQNQNTSWSLKNLPNGTYYWGVQSIDTALAGSSFASGGTFIVGGGVTYTIQGQIRLANGTGIDDITVTATGRPSTTTTGGGYYSFVVPLGWSGYIAPLSYAYSFIPDKRCYSNVNQNYPNDDFIATPLNYSISGRVTLNGSPTTGLAGVTITASNGGGSATTNTQGYYTIYNVQGGWMGDLIPSKAGYTFAPTSIPVTLPLTGNLTNKNFVATPNTPATFTISGTVLDNLNVPLSGATITLSTGQSTTTNGSGFYQFANINSGWNGTISASATGYNVVAVAPFMVIPITSNQTQNFTATPLTFTISGTVANLTTCQTYPITVTATGSGSFQTYTTSVSSGSYTIDNVPYGWTGTLSISSPAYTFTAVAPIFNGGPLTGSVTQNYTATLNTYNFSGNIIGLVPGLNVTVTVAPTCSNVCGPYQTPAAIVLPAGVSTYSFTVPYGWQGAITASSPAYTLTAATPVFNGGPVTAAVTQDFMALLNTYTITGTINGLLSGNTYPVTITAQGTGSFQTFTADATSGSYTINNVPYGWTGSLSASSAAYTFTPTSIPVPAVNANLTGQNFIATLKTFSITGTISGLLSGNTYPVTITATGTNGYPNFTASAVSGSYSMSLPYGWTGSLVATSAAYNLVETPSVTFTSPVTANQVQDYSAALKTFSITGAISGLLTGNTYPITITATGTSGSTNFSATTTGLSYTISNVPYGWTGSLSATSAAYNLTEDPAVTFTSPVTADQVQNYAATLKTFSVSGDISGIIAGTSYPITIKAQASGAYSSLTVDASSGHYTMTLPYGWTGALVASSPAYDLTEDPTITFTAPVTQDQVQNYKAILKKFAVSGNISNLLPGNSYPVTITANCSNPSGIYQTTTADATSGNYMMKLPYGWEGSLSASSIAYILVEDPSVTFVSPVTQDQIQDYKAQLQIFTITGTVYRNTSNETVPLQGVRLDAKGTVNNQPYTQTVQNAADGTYSITVPYSWKGTVKPSKDGYTFMPTSRSYNNVTANYTAQDYLGTATGPTPAITYTISGYVKTAGGQPISGVVIKDNASILTYTNAQGFYTLNKAKGWSGTVTPVKQGYKFNPANRSYTNLSGNKTNQNYTGKQ
jgi:hypothetical protein